MLNSYESAFSEEAPAVEHILVEGDARKLHRSRRLVDEAQALVSAWHSAGSHHDAAGLLCTLAIASDHILKAILIRPRPEMALAAAGDWSLPPDHTTPAVCAAALMALIWLGRSPDHPAAKISLCSLPTILVSLSRVFLGVHYVTDVLAAVPLGSICAWAIRMAASISSRFRTRGFTVRRHASSSL
ncbi:MAG: phosphatase PAP2 family protein [Coriobacteriaceae bacterium]|nr:MAG: phosphatase PAP2 family protein [Coriobacteriaceae bacterium]